VRSRRGGRAAPSDVKTVDAGDLADELGREQSPDPGLGEQLRGGLHDQLGELVVQFGDRAGELADAADHVAGDRDADRWVGVRQAPRDLGCQPGWIRALRGISSRARGRAAASAAR